MKNSSNVLIILLDAKALTWEKKFNICYKAFQSVYDISRYKRKVLLSEVKDGIKNSENGLTEWSKVHDATLQSISAYLRCEVND
jgi:hypothetical protein